MQYNNNFRPLEYLVSLAMTILILGTACKSDGTTFDASGVFESTEIIVSSEATGVIRTFAAGEGDKLALGEEVAQIEVTVLALQKAQVEATIDAIGDKRNDAGPQVSVLEQQLLSADAAIATLQVQLDVLEKEQDRTHRLYTAKAATEQQRDDIDGKLSVLENQIKTAMVNKDVLKAQIASAKRSVAIQNRGISSETKPLEQQKAQIEERLRKSTVINPVSGTMLTKYAFVGEFVTVGKPLYRLANLNQMELRAYVDGTQLSEISIGQEVEVLIDQGSKGYYTYPGAITWIADKAEFTPKSIQTRDERAQLVYAIKIRVVNDGKIKIGMYGEVHFDAEKEPL